MATDATELLFCNEHGDWHYTDLADPTCYFEEIGG